jgi:DNA-binding XRE family transcriptional regulator
VRFFINQTPRSVVAAPERGCDDLPSITYHSPKGGRVSPVTPPADYMSRAIRLHRERLSLSQSQLGEMIGVSGFSVGTWERGESLPTSENIQRLAGLFEVTSVALRSPQSSHWKETVFASVSVLQEVR